MNKAEKIGEAQWIRDMAPHFWSVIEATHPSATGKGVAKLAHFLLLARDAYAKASKTPLSIAGEEKLKTIAAGLSAGAKLNPPSVPVSTSK